MAVGVLGLACCVVETEAATAGRAGLDAPGPDAAVALVVAGTVTDAVAPLVAATVAAHPGAAVVAFGACASAGGPYWDSPVVTKGVDQLVAVDRYVPGCPPTPAALDAALVEVHAALAEVHAASAGVARG
nr:proton-conducting membrane transporter [Propioniciclava soli]